jgi:peptide/nickel transport system permease protein
MRWQIKALIGVMVVSLCAPLVMTFDPMLTDTARQLEPPNREHILGTDTLGRDVFSRLVHGGQRTLVITLLATGLALVIGCGMGIASGMSGGWFDDALSVVTNALLAFPSLLAALIVLTLMGGSAISLAVATGFAQIAPCARISRAAVLGIRSMGYVEAARASGASRFYIVRYAIFPNIYPTLFTYAGVTFSYCLLNSAALSFLGLGGQPGIPDWGVMLAEGRMALRAAPWVGIAPGLAISITVWLVNSLTDYKSDVTY